MSACLTWNDRAHGKKFDLYFLDMPSKINWLDLDQVSFSA